MWIAILTLTLTIAYLTVMVAYMAWDILMEPPTQLPGGAHAILILIGWIMVYSTWSSWEPLIGTVVLLFGGEFLLMLMMVHTRYRRKPSWNDIRCLRRAMQYSKDRETDIR